VSASYDAIVLGTGGVGSAALFQLAKRGARVLGIDRFSGGHDRGSSHGQTRIIRQAYFEHADYVPLLLRAYELWADLEARRGEKLLHQVGLVEIGPPRGIVVQGVLESARLHQLPVDHFSADEARRRFPGLEIPEGYEAVFERTAGYLLVERCVLAHLAEAERLGAVLRTGESVLRWTADASGVTVETDQGRYSAGKLIVSAGAWARELLADVGICLRVLRKHLHWYGCDDQRYDEQRGCPTFLYEMPSGVFYGFPAIDDFGLKVGEHSGGALVTDLLTDDRSVEPEDRLRVEAFLAECLPGVSRRPTRHTTCFYTMSPDEHFIVDRHPAHENIVFAAGLSGHGFKFTGVLGEILADLALEGRTAQPIEFLRSTRPGLAS
jgi:sarcosine oxidase